MSFEHLDDADAFQPTSELRSAVERRGRALRRRRRAGVVAAGVAMAFVLVVGVGAAAAFRTAGKVQRVDTAEALTPVESLDQPYTVLLVGSDSSDGAADAGSGRSDAILLVRVDPVGNRLGVVSVPRDLWVGLGEAGPGRINSAYGLGGPELLIDSVEGALGVAVNHYVEVDFNGFRDIVDEVGGVEIDVVAPLRDPFSGLDLAAGCQTLDGDQALALARSRSLEVDDASGGWTADPAGDLGRMSRQRTLLLVALGELQGQRLDPFGVDDLVGLLTANTQVDSTFSIADLAATLRFLQSVPVDSIDQGMVPARSTTIDGASVLEATPDALAAVRSILDGMPAPLERTDQETSATDTVPIDPLGLEPLIRTCS